MLSLSDISELTILERVDEYSLYCFYLGYEPVIGAKTNSVLRTKDDKASFGVFERKRGNPEDPHEFLWKDQGLPYPNFGDIFDLVKILFRLTRWEAIIKVAEDFGLVEGSTNVPKTLIHVPVKKRPCEISFKERVFTPADYKYWEQFHISKNTLEFFKVKAVSYYFLYKEKDNAFKPVGNMYAYKIQSRYQLYQPNPKLFIMDWTDSCIPGFEQLRGNEVCIITKSYKDVMLLWQLGFDGCSITKILSFPVSKSNAGIKDSKLELYTLNFMCIPLYQVSIVKKSATDNPAFPPKPNLPIGTLESLLVENPRLKYLRIRFGPIPTP